jgi:hypothetical protein
VRQRPPSQPGEVLAHRFRKPRSLRCRARCHGSPESTAALHDMRGTHTCNRFLRIMIVSRTRVRSGYIGNSRTWHMVNTRGVGPDSALRAPQVCASAFGRHSATGARLRRTSPLVGSRSGATAEVEE